MEYGVGGFPFVGYANETAGGEYGIAIAGPGFVNEAVALVAWTGEAVFAGAGSLLGATAQRMAAQAELDGASGLSAATLQRLVAQARFAGAGRFSAEVFVPRAQSAQAIFGGFGGMSVEVQRVLAPPTYTYTIKDSPNSDYGIRRTRAKIRQGQLVIGKR